MLCRFFLAETLRRFNDRVEVIISGILVCIYVSGDDPDWRLFPKQRNGVHDVVQRVYFFQLPR
jgi:hypothetical protein